MTRGIKNEGATIRKLPVAPSSKVVEGGLVPLAIRSTVEFEHSATAGVLLELARSSSSHKCCSVEVSGVVEHQTRRRSIPIAAAYKLVQNIGTERQHGCQALELSHRRRSVFLARSSEWVGVCWLVRRLCLRLQPEAWSRGGGGTFQTPRTEDASARPQPEDAPAGRNLVGRATLRIAGIGVDKAIAVKIPQ